VSSLELDLSLVRSGHEIHVALSSLLGFPAWYGHNWDAFWDLISSSHPLPERLTVRGLDHVERVLPREANLMLGCLGDYNNDTGRVCVVSVSDDYNGRLFFLGYEAKPDVPMPNVCGAIISCWIKAESAREAHAIATNKLLGQGWKITAHTEVSPVDLTGLADEGEDSRIRQACIDGAVFNIHRYESE
jgi:ribonuclease inhibitor